MNDVNDLASLPFDTLLDRLADRSPTPGGGAAAAATGALAAALARMVTAYSIRQDTEPAARRELEELLVRLRRIDALLRALMTEDARAYASLRQAARAAEKKEAAYQEALLTASAVPTEMAALLSEMLASLDAHKKRLNRALESDLGIVLRLATAAARAAERLVQINVTEMQDETRRERLLRGMADTVKRCDQLAWSIFGYLERRGA
ncbi:MAG: hypothetical protein D6788_07885 [Planctomycetota bacterium]|nr:MAG: hypothetical protein D6788_07885 [Planctomycetota bacterium]